MSIFNPSTDEKRKVLVGYLSTAVAALMALSGMADLLDKHFPTHGTSFQQQIDWYDKVLYVARSSDFLGIFLVAGAFLLMLDSEEEPSGMRFAIVVNFLVSIWLMVIGAIGIGAAVIHSPDKALLALNPFESVVDCLITLVLGATASAITWVVVRDLHDEDKDFDEPTDDSPELAAE